MLADADEAGVRALLGDWQEIVGPAVGLAAPEGAAPPDPQGVRDGLDWVVTNLAHARGPLVLVVDDAHWADPHSLSWLAAFASRLADLPVLLAVAYRPAELPDWAEAFRAMPGDNGVRPLGLEPLSPEAVAELCARFYADSRQRVDEAFGREVWAVTGGNPSRPSNSSPRPAIAGSPRGGGVAGAAPHRAGHPGPRAGRTDRATGRSGGPVGLVRGRPRHRDPARAGRPGRVPVPRGRRGGSRETAPGPGADGRAGTGVHPPLVASSVYGAIPDELRTGLHERAAWILVETGRSPVVVARHWLEVEPTGNPDVVSQLRAAAGMFMQAGAPDAAQRCLRRAVAEPPPDELRAQVHFELGSSTLLYDPQATVDELREALAQPDLSPELHLGASVLLAQSLAHSNRLSEAAACMAREAARAARPDHRLRLEVWEFMWCAFDAHEQDSEARSQRLADLAQLLELEHPGGPPDTATRYVWGLRAWDATVRGEDHATALRYADLALQGSGLSWADPEWGFEVPVLTALVHMFADRPERAVALFAEGIAEYERAGWRGAHLAFAHTILGYVHYRSGDLADAEREARTGLDIADRVGEGLPVHWYATGTLIAVLVARGKVAEASEYADAYRFQAPFSNAVTFPDSQTVLGALLQAAGDPAGAEAVLRDTGARLDRRGMRNPGWSPWRRVLANVLVGEGRSGEARELARESLRYAERFGTASARGAAHLAVAETLPANDPARLDHHQRAADLLATAPAPTSAPAPNSPWDSPFGRPPGGRRTPTSRCAGPWTRPSPSPRNPWPRRPGRRSGSRAEGCSVWARLLACLRVP
ncbi:ATP-binding protein [Streptacidiphilus monticola]